MKKSPSAKKFATKKAVPKKAVAVVARDYDSVLSGVVELLQEARRASARTVNAIMTATYWEVGRRIVEGEQGGKERADYGKELLKRLSVDLTGRFGRGFSVDNLQRFRSFFVAFPLSEIYATASRKSVEQKYATPSRISAVAAGPLFQTLSAIFVTGEPTQKSQTPSGQLHNSLNDCLLEIVQTPSALLAEPILQSPIGESQAEPPFSLLDVLRSLSQRFPLPWSHYVRMLSVKNPLAREFYEIEALRGGWTVKQLNRQIGTQFYERTALSRNKAAMLTKGQQPKPEDAVSVDEEIKDSFVLEFLGLKDEYSESELEEALIRHLETFLLELGGDFTFVGRQRRLRIDDVWYRVDLLFFHRALRCLVIIDLKLDRLTPADIGQMHLYCNYAKANWSRPDENPPVGIILSSGQGDSLVRYALEGLPNPTLVREYRLLLPDEKLLADELTRTRRLLEARLAARPTRRKT